MISLWKDYYLESEKKSETEGVLKMNQPMAQLLGKALGAAVRAWQDEDTRKALEMMRRHVDLL